MAQTLTEQIRIWMDRIEEAAPPQPQRRSYDLELEVENWEDPQVEDDPNWKPERTLGIDYRITGSHRPATWGDWGGDPPETPDLEEINVYDAETGQPLDNLPDYLDEQIVDAIWEHAEEKKNDYPEPDYDYDDYRSRRRY